MHYSDVIGVRTLEQLTLQCYRVNLNREKWADRVLRPLNPFMIRTQCLWNVADLVHRAHVDDAIPLWRHSQDLIQDLLHVQLLTLSIVKPVHYWGTFYSQMFQHSTPGGYREGQQTQTVHSETIFCITFTINVSVSVYNTLKRCWMIQTNVRNIQSIQAMSHWLEQASTIEISSVKQSFFCGNILTKKRRFHSEIIIYYYICIKWK